MSGSTAGFTVYPIVVDKPGGGFPEIIDGHTEAGRILGLLDRHFHGMHPEPADDPTGRSSFDQLAAWSGDADQPRNSMLVWIGHGVEDPPVGAYLLTEPGTEPLQPDSIARRIRAEASYRNEIRTGTAPTRAWAMVIVVACGAARLVELIQSRLALAGDQPRRLLLIGVGDSSPTGARPTFLAEFTTVLTAVLDSYTDNDEVVDVHDLVGRLGRRFGRGGFVAPVNLFDGDALRRRTRVLSPGVTAPLDAYTELVRLVDGLPPEIRDHFAVRGLGADPTELAWNFVGRADERREILRWLRNRDRGMLVVTGTAGVGKSALLGNLLMLRDARLTDVLIDRGHLDRDIERDRPDPDVFTDVLHLAGVTVADVVDRLAAAAGLGPAPAGTALGDRVTALLTGLNSRTAPFAVLADALDESRQPTGVASVLRRVAAIGACRVVVGTRSSTTEDPDRPVSADTATGDLLDALGLADTGTSVVVVPRNRALIEDYVERQLGAAKTAGRLTSTDETIATAAERIADGDRPFLFARLAVYEIVRDPRLLDSPAEAGKVYSASHGSLFAAAVQRLADSDPAGAALLRALGYAQGRGVPRGNGVWATIATAVSGTPVGEEDVDRLLAGATPYVLTDSDAGSAVYRLSHRTFQEHLLDEPDAADLRRRAADGLLTAVTAADGTLDRHLRRNLSAYVRAGDRWDHLADLPDVLDRLDPDAVAADVVQATFQGRRMPAGLAGIVDVWARMVEAPVPDRGFYRHLGVAGQRGLVAVDPAGSDAVAGPWRLRWAVMERRPSGGRFTGYRNEVTALAAVPLKDGRTLLACGGKDGVVRLWDPATGLPTGEPLTDHRGFVLGLASCRLRDGRDLLVVGSGGGTVRLWDPNTGAQVSSIDHPSGLRRLVCVLLPDGQSVVVTGDGEGMLRRIDPSTGAPLGPPTDAHRGKEITGLVTVELPDGRTLVASGGKDGTVAVWNPRNGRRLARRSLGDTASVWALADLADAGIPGSLAISGQSGVHVWQPLSTGLLGRARSVAGGRLPLVRRRFSPNTLVAFTVPGDGPTDPPAGVLCGVDAQIELWDPGTGDRRAQIPSGAAGSTTAAVVLPDAAGRPILALGGADGDIRMWGDWPPTTEGLPDLASGACALLWADGASGGSVLLAGTPDGRILRCADDGTSVERARHPGGRVRGLALVPADGRSGDTGRAMLVSCGGDGVLRCWDASTGDAIGRMTGGHDGEALSVHCYRLPDGRLRLASTGMDQRVRIWDPGSGRQVVEPLTGHRNWVWRVVPVPTGTDRPVLASSDANGIIHVWDAVDGRPVGSPMGLVERVVLGLTLYPSGRVRALTGMRRPDGTAVAVAGSSDGAVRMWDPGTGGMVGPTMRAPTGGGGVEAVAVLPGDGAVPELIVAGYGDGVVAVLDPATGRCLHTVDLDGTVRALAVSGTRTAVGLDTGAVMLNFRAEGLTPGLGGLAVAL